MSNMTTAQMQSALAKINPSKAAPVVKEASPLNVADLIADTGAGIVGFVTEASSHALTTVSTAGTGTANFAERVKVRYQYQRAKQKGLILEAPAPAARRATKAS